MGRPKKLVLDDLGADPSDFETRHRVIQASMTLFKEKGYKGVSMKDVAEAVSITPAALYYYFPDGKEALFLAVLETILDERRQGMEQAIAGNQGIEDRLYALTMYFLTVGNDTFPILMRDVAAQVRDDKKWGEIWHRLRSDYIDTVTRIFQEAGAAGEITSAVSPSLLATLFTGMNFSLGRGLHFRGQTIEKEGTAADSLVDRLRNSRGSHFHAQTIDSQTQAEAERLARTVVDILLNGIRGCD